MYIMLNDEYCLSQPILLQRFLFFYVRSPLLNFLNIMFKRIVFF